MRPKLMFARPDTVPPPLTAKTNTDHYNDICLLHTLQLSHDFRKIVSGLHVSLLGFLVH